MDLWDIFTVALRQWRVLVPLLVLTFALTLFTSGVIDPEYNAEGVLLLVGPNENAPEGAQSPPSTLPGQIPAPTLAPQPVNPYLSFSGSLPVTAEALRTRLDSAQVREGLQGADLSTNYEVELDERNPIFRISVLGDRPSSTLATLNRLIDVAGEELVRLQSDRSAPETQYIGLDVLAQNTDATEDAGALNRVRILVLGLGIVVSVVAAFAAEGILARLQARRTTDEPGRHSRAGAHGPPDPQEPPHGDPDPVYGPAGADHDHDGGRPPDYDYREGQGEVGHEAPWVTSGRR